MKSNKGNPQAIAETIPLFDAFAAQILSSYDLTKYTPEQQRIITQTISGYLIAAILGIDQMILHGIKQELQEWERIDSIETWILDFFKRFP